MKICKRILLLAIIIVTPVILTGCYLDVTSKGNWRTFKQSHSAYQFAFTGKTYGPDNLVNYVNISKNQDGTFALTRLCIHIKGAVFVINPDLEGQKVKMTNGETVRYFNTNGTMIPQSGKSTKIAATFVRWSFSDVELDMTKDITVEFTYKKIEGGADIPFSFTFKLKKFRS